MSSYKDTININGELTGIGDLSDLQSVNLINFFNLIDVNISGSSIPTSYIKIDDTDRRPLLDFEIKPGFFYIGDKEYYLFSTKVTDVVNLQSNSTSFQLKSYPNGFSPINMYGPFNISSFSGIFKDELIDNNNIIKSLYLNEIISDNIPTGHTSNPEYPLYFSPYSPISQCYYYRDLFQTKNIDIRSYRYDVDTNSIVLTNFVLDENGNIIIDQNTGLPVIEPGYYIFEYEDTTLTTLTGESWDPVTKDVEDSILVLSTGLEITNPDTINILDIEYLESYDAIAITFRILNFNRNVVPNLSIDCSVDYTYKNEDGEILSYSNQVFNRNYFINDLDIAAVVDTVIYQNNKPIALVKQQNTQFVAPNFGMLSDSLSGTPKYTQQIVTDSNGIGTLYVLKPTIKSKSEDISISFSHNNSILHSIWISNNNDKSSNPIIDPINRKYGYNIFKVTHDTTSWIIINGIKDLYDLEIYTIKNYIDYISGISLLRNTTINSIDLMADNTLKLHLSMNINDGDYVIIKSNQLDGKLITLNSNTIY